MRLHFRMRTISFKRHRLPPGIIRYAIWLYARFALSFRDVEDLLAEQGPGRRGTIIKLQPSRFM